jgi:hypothetical protein
MFIINFNVIWMTNLVIVKQYCCTPSSCVLLHAYAQTLSNIIIVLFHRLNGMLSLKNIIVIILYLCEIHDFLLLQNYLE